MTDFTERIRANKKDYDAKVARIRGDADLSPEGRAKAIKAEHDRHIAAHQELVSTAQTAAQAASQEAYRAAFGPGFKSPNPDEQTILMTHLNYRDALGRAAAADSPEALRQLRQRAKVVGDRLLERATTVLAFERGDRLILQEAAAVDSAVRAVVEGDLGDGMREQFTDAIALSVMSPQLPADARDVPALATDRNGQINAALRSHGGQ